MSSYSYGKPRARVGGKTLAPVDTFWLEKSMMLRLFPQAKNRVEINLIPLSFSVPLIRLSHSEAFSFSNAKILFASRLPRPTIHL